MNITELGPEWFEENVWQADSETRDYMTARADYYQGDHDILDEEAVYADGSTKTQRVMNWVRYIIGRHKGALSSPKVMLTDLDTDAAALNQYNELIREQRVDSQDALLIRDAMLLGQAVEFHGFDSETELPQIKRYSPLQWAFLWDSDDRLAVAVRYVEYGDNSVYDGELFPYGLKAMAVYTAEETALFTNRRIETTDRDGNTVIDYKGWRGVPEPNVLGMIPIVVWCVDDDSAGLISDALMRLNDEYNELFSTEGDDIRAHVDAVLKIWGISDKFISAQAETIKVLRLLPFPEGRDKCDAEYLTRTLNNEPVAVHLDRTRALIHIMGCIPDTSQIVGATGATSGIALRLLFRPMIEAFEGYAPFLKEAIHDRIELLNARWKKLQAPVLKNYTVDFEFRIPTNNIEEWQNVGSLKGIVSHRTQLRLLSDVDDPEEEIKRMASEAPDTDMGRLMEQVGAMGNKQAALESRMSDFSGQIAASVAELLNGMKERMIPSGNANA